MDTAIISGPGRQLAALVQPLRAHNIRMSIVVFQNPARTTTAYRRFLESEGIEHVVVPFHSRFDRRLLSSFRSVLSELEPDIVQTHSYRPTTLAWLARRMGASWRWIGFFHGTTNEDLKVRVYHWLDKQLLPGADRLVVMSRTQAERFAGSRRKLMQIYNAVLPNRPSTIPADTRAQLDRVAALPRPRIGVIGRLSEEKGVDVILESLPRILASTSATLVVAGDGPERNAQEYRAQRLGVGASCFFPGMVNPIEPVYDLLDLVVIPSRSEGLPNVLLEALRADLPVVATRVGAIPEVLDGSTAGRLVAAADAEALAGAVIATLSEPRNASSSARAQVVSRFSLERRVDAHRQLYHEVLAQAAFA
jgi:glycosyltransferase involved in cell wall biosynthesis